MDTTHTTWEALQQTYMVIVQHHIGNRVQETVQSTGLGDVQGWFQLGLALNLRPDPLTADYLGKNTPYSNAAMYDTQLRSLKDGGLLDEAGHITDAGAEKYQALIDVQNEIVDALDSSIEQSDVFRDLTAQVVQAAQELKFNTMRLDAALRRDNGDQTPLTQGFYNCQRLFIFRDDAHIAAWQAHDLNGHDFEVFSLVWSGEATTADALAEARNEAYRGHTPDDHQAALDRLVNDGWLTLHDDGTYTPTDRGQALRDDIEQQTDANFYAPFKQLSDDEHAQLQSIATDIQQTLTPASEDA